MIHLSSTKKEELSSGSISNLAGIISLTKPRRDGWGFTIFELLVVLAISAALTIQVLPESVLEADQFLVDQVVSNAQIYVDAVYAKCADQIAAGGAFTQCWGAASAYSLSSLQSDGFIGVAGAVSNPYANADSGYEFTVTEATTKSIEISFKVIGRSVAEQVASRLPAGTWSLDSGDVYDVSLRLPTPANESAHTLLVKRSGDTLSGDLDFGGNAATSLAIISTTNSTAANNCNINTLSSSQKKGTAAMPVGCEPINLHSPLLGDYLSETLSYTAHILGDLQVGYDAKIDNSLQVGADVVASAYYYDSDIAVKRNINNISSLDIQKLMKLLTISYTHIASEKEKFGFVAQDVKEHFPDLVTTRDEGILAVDYQAFIPLLVHIVAEQQRQINQLTKESKHLEE